MIGVMVATLALGGGVCHQQAVVHQQYVAPVYTPQVYYFVGSPIRAQAVMQQDDDYQEFQAFKAWKQTQSREQQVQPVTQAESGLVKQLCGKCHAEPNQGNSFYAITGDDLVSAEKITKAIRAVAYGHMPKDRQLSKEEKNALLAELLSLEQGVEE